MASPNGSLPRTTGVDRQVFDEAHFDGDFQRTRRRSGTRRRLRLSTVCQNGDGSRRKAAARFLRRTFPMASWFPNYFRANAWKKILPGDLLAGLTVGVMHIPQGLAYALLANLQPVYGLYTSLVPPLVYMFLGTSRHISVGTFAVVSLMVGEVIKELAVADDSSSSKCADNSTVTTSSLSAGTLSANYTSAASGTPMPVVGSTASGPTPIMVAVAVALMVGVYQILMWIFQLGFLTIFLSEPLVSGFTTGAAFHVGMSQVKHIFGICMENPKNPFAIFKVIGNILTDIDETNIASLLTGIIAGALIYIIKRFNLKQKDRLPFPIPAELTVLIFATLISWSGKFKDDFDVDVVNEIPTGAPPLQFGNLVDFPIADVAASAVPIAIVSYAVSVSLAQSFATAHDYKVDSNQELFALGLTNLVGSFFSSFACAASLSRSAVYESVGANTQLGTVFASVIVLLVLLFIAPLFSDLPKAVLAAIILVALKNLLLQFRRLKYLWTVSRTDAIVWFFTWLFVVLFGVDIGLGLGLLVSLVTVVYHTSRPHYCVLGRAEDTEIYRELSGYEKVHTIPGVRIFRFESSIFFVNTGLFRSCLIRKTGIDPAVIRHRRKQSAKASADSPEHLPANGMLKHMSETSLGQLHSIGVSSGIGAAPAHESSDEESDSDYEAIAERSPAQTSVHVHVNGKAVVGHKTVLECKTTPAADDGFNSERVKTIVVDFSPVNYIDTQAVAMLIAVAKDYHTVGVQFLLAGCRRRVRRLLEKAGFCESIGYSHLFVTVHDAVEFASQGRTVLQRPGGVSMASSADSCGDRGVSSGARLLPSASPQRFESCV